MGERKGILVIGGTGHLGKLIAEASIEAGHRTFVLIRDSTFSNPHKSHIIKSFTNQGIILLHGDIYDHDSLVKAIEQVDVVISAVGSQQLADQLNIIDAIKQVGKANIKRFIPSDFGSDVDVSAKGAVEPAKSFLESKVKIRRAIEAEEIPYTYISCNGFITYLLDCSSQEHPNAFPRDKIVILGDGNPKGIFNKEKDIAKFTIRTVDDPKTLNTILHIRPPSNTISFNELVTMWEKKIGKTLEKIYIPEDEVLQIIQESPFPKNLLVSLGHAVFVRGVMANNPTVGVEATELYPEVEYTTIDEYLDEYVNEHCLIPNSFIH